MRRVEPHKAVPAASRPSRSEAEMVAWFALLVRTGGSRGSGRSSFVDKGPADEAGPGDCSRDQRSPGGHTAGTLVRDRRRSGLGQRS